MAGIGRHRTDKDYTKLYRSVGGFTTRLWRALLALLLVVPFVSYYGVGHASAALGGDTPFEIDGDTTGPDDWEVAVASGAYNAVLTQDLCNLTGDDIIVPSTKLDDNPWPTRTGNVVDKGDLCKLWTGWDRAPDGDIIFLLGWERYGNTGEVTVYVPLDGAPFGGRTGDRLLKFEYDSNTKLITVTLLSWNGSTWGSQASITGFAEAVVSSDTRFAEVALNLTESGLLPSGECRSFVGAFAISETGQADANPTLKDHVDLSEPIEFNSCASVTVEKVTEPVEGLPGPFTFHLTGVTPKDGQLNSGGDSVIYDDLLAGNYGLTEDDPSALLFEMTSIVCDGQDLTQGGSFEVLSNKSYLCTITNTSLAAPQLSLVKLASPSTYAGVGDVVSYSYVLTNSGNVSLSGPFTIDDDKATDESCPVTASLAPAASITCTATYTITQADLDAGSVTNVATGQGFFNEQPVVSNPDTETVTAVFSPQLSLVKLASPSTYAGVGDVVSYSYVLTNSGNVSLSGPFTIDDDKATDESCPVTASLAPAASITCTATYTITQADLDAGSVTNVATGQGFFNEQPVVSNPDTETVTAVFSPQLSLVKLASPSTYAGVGDVVSYSYVLTNSGNVSLSGPFTIDDDKATDESCPVTASLAPAASITCTATYTITQADLDAGSVTNVATGQGFFNEQPVVSNPDTETVTTEGGPQLSLVKLASPSTYAGVGDVVSYSYVLTNSGNVSLSGPFTIDDDKATDESCPVTASLAPAASITCTATYTITQADLDAGSVTNVATGQGFFNEQPVVSNPDTETVTAVFSPQLSLVKLASPSTYAGVGDVVSYSYVLTNSGNVSLSGPFTIDDDKATDESCPVTASLAPAASITCTATYTITQADLDAGSVTNVATGQGFFNEQPVVSNPDTETVTKPSTPNPKPSPKGAIGDLVWEDTNADGYQGDFESGVAGVTVHLLDDGGLIIDTASTDASGNYLFSGLSPGTYEVQFILPAGFAVSPVRAAPPATDSDAGVAGRTGAITLTSGETDLTWDAGIYRTPEVLPQVITTTTTSTPLEVLPFTGSSQGGVGVIGVTLLLFGFMVLFVAGRSKADLEVVGRRRTRS